MTPLFGSIKPSEDSPEKSDPCKKETTHPLSLEAEIYCDGACSGNPGESGVGILILIKGDKEKELRISEYIGEATNNIAEYSALIRGLTEAVSEGVMSARVFMDSELVVKQVNGEYKVKNQNLKKLWIKAMGLIDRFEKIKVEHIRRELNQEADALARKSVSARKRG
jgi:ribonuclease HI